MRSAIQPALLPLGAWDGGVTGGELGPVDLRLLETLAFLAHGQLLGLEGRGLGPTRV